MRRPALVLVLVLIPILAGCGAAGSTPTASSGEAQQTPRRLPAVEPEALPSSYRYVLESSCGERTMLGRFRIEVRDDRVVAVRPVGDTSMKGFRRSDLPTLSGLVELATSAEPEAVVDLRLGPHGTPVSLKIDHVPQAIDDEECYRVTRLHRLPG